MTFEEAQRLRHGDQVARVVSERFTIQQGIVERRPLGWFTEVGTVVRTAPELTFYFECQFETRYEPLAAVDLGKITFHRRREDVGTIADVFSAGVQAIAE